MGSEWSFAKVEDIAANTPGAIAIGPFGSRMKSDTYTDDGVPVIRGTNIGDLPGFRGHFVFISEKDADEMKNCNVFAGDLVFPHRGSIGETGIVTGEVDRYMLSTSLMKLSVDRSRVDPRFLYHWFRSKDGRHALLANASQVGTPGIATPLTSLKGITVPLPPLSQQQAIAEVLGSLDDKIELNRRMNRTLELMARAFFRSWFVEFDPVRANAAGTPLIPPDLAAHFPAAFEPSPLGDIPSGWEVQPIGDVVECVGGGTPSTKNHNYWEGGTHHWATPKDLSSLDEPVLTTTSRRLTDSGVDKVSSGLLDRGTVLMSSRAPVGYLAITEIPVAINQGFIAMKPTDRMPAAYLLHWCRHNLNTIKGQAGGTTFAEISKRAFRPIPAIVPPSRITAAFAELADPLYRRITLHVHENATLAALRDALLPSLLSGKLDPSSLGSTPSTEQEGRE